MINNIVIYIFVYLVYNRRKDMFREKSIYDPNGYYNLKLKSTAKINIKKKTVEIYFGDVLRYHFEVDKIVEINDKRE